MFMESVLKKALQLVKENNIKSIEMLRENQNLLNDTKNRSQIL